MRVGGFDQSGPQSIRGVGDSLGSYPKHFEDIMKSLESAIAYSLRNIEGAINSVKDLLYQAARELRQSGKFKEADQLAAIGFDFEQAATNINGRWNPAIDKLIDFVKADPALQQAFGDRFKSITLLYQIDQMLKKEGMSNFTADKLVKILKELQTTEFGKENSTLIAQFLTNAESINKKWDPQWISEAWDKTMANYKDVIDILVKKYL